MPEIYVNYLTDYIKKIIFGRCISTVFPYYGFLADFYIKYFASSL